MEMRKALLSIISIVATASAVVACGSGGSGSTPPNPNPTFADDPTPPSPNPQSGMYGGVPFANLTPPSSVAGGALANPYPSTYLPNGLQSLQIAYGKNEESAVANLSAYVTMGSLLCSATPVKYDQSSNTTFLVGAAHCFVDFKSNAATLQPSNITPLNLLNVYFGVNGNNPYIVRAVYLRTDYCQGSTFTGGNDECPNFSPNQGVINGQGNDIAVIQITGKYGNPESYPYPEVVPASQYPTTYSMAPVLSIGYGVNTQTPSYNDRNLPRSTMYYVAGYQYWQQDTTGYHYLYNSFYNTNTSYPYSSGYTALICGGDSGGGDLFWTGSKWILLSEHTYGPSKACGTFYNYLPNAATNVSAYYDWIQSIIRSGNDAVANCKNGIIDNCVTNG
jgi:hypothetical protein